jgi:hypothetical protein
MYSYLEENGYVVLRNMANQDELAHGYELFWKYFNLMFPNVKRHGILSTAYLCQISVLKN